MIQVIMLKNYYGKEVIFEVNDKEMHLITTHLGKIGMLFSDKKGWV